MIKLPKDVEDKLDAVMLAVKFETPGAGVEKYAEM
jgi:hypothetical protein